MTAKPFPPDQYRQSTKPPVANRERDRIRTSAGQVNKGIRSNDKMSGAGYVCQTIPPKANSADNQAPHSKGALKEGKEKGQGRGRMWKHAKSPPAPGAGQARVNKELMHEPWPYRRSFYMPPQIGQGGRSPPQQWARPSQRGSRGNTERKQSSRKSGTSKTLIGKGLAI